MMHGFEDETLAQARQRLHSRLDGGLFCPCCGQYAKRYRRKMNSGMARALINIYRHGYRGNFEWVYIPNLSAKSREEGKIAYWGLLEELQEPREDGGRAGWWRVTPAGEDFILRGRRIPKLAIVYNGVCTDFDNTEMVNIHDCLGEKFNLNELLGAR
jgi:hypothetical protein